MNIELMNVLAGLQDRHIEFTLSRPDGKFFVKVVRGELTKDERMVLKANREVLIKLFEDDEMSRTGVIQSERQVFEMAEAALAEMNQPRWGERKAS